MEASTIPWLSWEALYPIGSLPDERLRKRAIVIGEASTQRPGSAMTEAFDEWKGSRNAYNFFDNKRLSIDVLLAPPMKTVADLIRNLPPGATVLNVQDTTEINFSHLKTMTGLGEIGNPKNQGLFLHPSLALGADGVPLGLLSAQTWARPTPETRKTKAEKNEVRKAAPFEEKESVRWWAAILGAELRVARPGVLLHMGDRENDIYEVFERANNAGYRLLVRAAQDRRVDGDHGMLWAQVASFPSSDERQSISVPARPAKDGQPARAAREATVAIRYGAISLCAPKKPSDTVKMWAIEVYEVDPPEGIEPIDWLLLTNDPIASFVEAWQHVEWYRFRWRIEEFFNLLKSGCRIEARQFESRENFEASLAISLLTAVRLLALVKQARVAPDAPASTVLQPAEEIVLGEHAALKKNRPVGPMSLEEAVILIAMLGGYKGRSCDGPPGWITLWRGYRRLGDMVEGYTLAQPRKRQSRSKRKTSPTEQPS